MKERGMDRAWEKIFSDHNMEKHDFGKKPYQITAKEIGHSCQDFKKPSEKEARILCKQDTRESRPQVFINRGLFLLPISNGIYNIFQGEGYVDIPPITSPLLKYTGNLPFALETSAVGNSEMQYLDYAYAVSLIRNFINDDSLVLTIRGRKYTPEFSFNVGPHPITVSGVQVEVDAGYEGQDIVVLVEAKNNKSTDTIIRQLYYPYRMWQTYTEKNISVLFFLTQDNSESKKIEYHFWEFCFNDYAQYNSIFMKRAERFYIGVGE